jgi:hypothetical protein
MSNFSWWLVAELVFFIFWRVSAVCFADQNNRLLKERKTGWSHFKKMLLNLASAEQRKIRGSSPGFQKSLI